MIKITNIGSASISIVSWSGSRMSLSSQESVYLDEPFGGQVMSYYNRLSFSAPIKIEAPVKRPEASQQTTEVISPEPVKEVSNEVIDNVVDNAPVEEVVNSVESDDTISTDVEVSNSVEVEEANDTESTEIDQEPVIDLSSLTVKQLYQYAEDKGIALDKGLSKKQILKALNA